MSLVIRDLNQSADYKRLVARAGIRTQAILSLAHLTDKMHRSRSVDLPSCCRTTTVFNLERMAKFLLFYSTLA